MPKTASMHIFTDFLLLVFLNPSSTCPRFPAFIGHLTCDQPPVCAGVRHYLVSVIVSICMHAFLLLVFQSLLLSLFKSFVQETVQLDLNRIYFFICQQLEKSVTSTATCKCQSKAAPLQQNTDFDLNSTKSNLF